MGVQPLHCAVDTPQNARCALALEGLEEQAVLLALVASSVVPSVLPCTARPQRETRVVSAQESVAMARPTGWAYLSNKTTHSLSRNYTTHNANAVSPRAVRPSLLRRSLRGQRAPRPAHGRAHCDGCTVTWLSFNSARRCSMSCSERSS